jgi:prepilin-type N-terminal cleavage/methylation domain-containing protein
VAHETKQRGFTLVETLVALALITMISLVVMGALAPWMTFKQKMDSDRRMQDVRQAFTALYNSQGMAIDQSAGGSFLGFTSSTWTVGARCASQVAAFQGVATYLSEAPQQIANDGFVNPWCLYVSGPLKEVRDGAELWYRNIALLSMGPNGVLDSTVAADGTLTINEDDSGIVISGREIQGEKLKETLYRLNRIGQVYETYFTTRYLATASRDVTLDYFSKLYDTTGSVDATSAGWTSAYTALLNIGVSAQDAKTPWELNNDIQVDNYSQVQGTAKVRSPVTTGTGALPYTALLRAPLPTPPSAPQAYAVQVVVGNY